MTATAVEPLPRAGRVRKFLTVLAVVIPPFGLVAAMVLLWQGAFHPIDLVLLVVLYLAVGFGVTIGFHRLFAHRSFRTSRPVEAVLAILGSMSIQGPLLTWVADHRKHHAHSDKEGDPHSPHVGHGRSLRGKLAGFWHAHIGWFFTTKGFDEESERYVKDIRDNRLLQVISATWFLWAAIGLAIPFGVGLAVGGFWAGVEALIWGGIVRIFLVHHVTWSINSICHLFGTRPYLARDESTNNWLLALPTLGESWHNNHHAFPASAVHGIDRGQIDISGLVIRGLERMRLVWDVNQPNLELRTKRRVLEADA